MNRTKSFAGCWTCRNRKIKCDLRRPTCQRCEKAKLECEGYSIKLRWARTGKEGEDGEEEIFRRRNVDFVEYPPEMTFETYREMDITLSKLHAPKFAADETVVLGPFGVFSGYKRRRIEPVLGSQPGPLSASAQGPNTPLAATHTPMATSHTPKMTPPQLAQRASPMVHPPMLVAHPHHTHMSPHSSGLSTHDLDMDIDLLMNNLPVHPPQIIPLTYFIDPNLDPSLEMDIEEPEPSPGGIIHRNIERMEENEVNTIFTIVQNDLAGTSFPKMPASEMQFSDTQLQFSSQSRYLLHHYITSVSQTMTVVGHPKNPWMQIFVPRAISAIGDLVATGYTTNSRNALLHALLAISAYNLQSRYPKNSPSRKHYSELGLRLKSEAYKLLWPCFTEDISDQKYKDVLVSILSMVPIDVVSGSMSDCRVHLLACQKFIEMRLSSRRDISPKAATLHRIFCFLRLLQESTVFTDLMEIDDEELNEVITDDQDIDTILTGADGSKMSDKKRLKFSDAGGGIFQKDSKKSGPRERKDSNEGYFDTPIKKSLKGSPNAPVPGSQRLKISEYWLGQPDLTPCSDSFDLSSILAMYGLPDSLQALLSRTTALAKRCIGFRQKKGTNYESEQIRVLEQDLLQWRFEKSKIDIPSFNENRKAVLHYHCITFHGALVIYFYRLVLGWPASSLQDRVKYLMHILLEMQNFKSKVSVISTPLLWAGFVGACEALTEDTRQGYTKYIQDLAECGMGTYYVPRNVITEAWRLQDKGEESNWWDIVANWEAHLLLS